MKKVAYSEARQFMDTGDLIVWHSHSLLGTMIQWFSEFWNHASILMNFSQFEGEEKHRWVAESLKSGPTLTLLSKKIEQHDGVVGWAPLKGYTPEMRNKVGHVAMEFLGCTGYDYWGLFAQIVHAPHAGGDVICSEYFQLAHGVGGKTLKPNELLSLPFLHDVMEVTWP